jgi:hypothetical protein
MKKLIILVLIIINLNGDVINLATNSINSLNNSSIENSTLKQSSLDVNNSNIIDTTFNSRSKIKESNIENDSFIKQSRLNIKNSGEIKNAVFNLNSNIENVVINDSRISQNEIEIDNSTIDNVTMSGEHSIYNETGTVFVSSSDITQGKLSLTDNSSLTNSRINMASDIDHTNITNASVDLCSIYIANGVDVDNVNIEGICSMDTVEITGANLVQGAVAIYQ